MKKGLLHIALCVVVCNTTLYSTGQQREHGTGMLWDQTAVALSDSIPMVADRITRDFINLPSSVSLLKYAPTCGNQGQYGTCTSWSSGYAAMSIANAINNNWTDQQIIDSNAFSPIFIYSQIKRKKGCNDGTYIQDALECMKNKGVPKKRTYNCLCDETMRPQPNIVAEASHNKIASYTCLIPYPAAIETQRQRSIALRNMKKALSEKRPIIVGVSLSKSFDNPSGDVWTVTPDAPGTGGHAMCVIGYDDNKYGGSFLVQNSWGQNWADKGRIWIRYSDFMDRVHAAFEFYLPSNNPKPRPTPAPDPQPVKPKHRFAGSIEVLLSTGEKMAFERINMFGNPIFESSKSYLSGTRYRIYLSNNQPAFVYIIASDVTKRVNRIFPPSNRISAALTYSSNNIALPDEEYYIEMDHTVGTDNICVLFSSQELDIDTLSTAIRQSSGSFHNRVLTVLGNKAENIKTFSNNGIAFSTTTDKSVLPLFIDIKHK